MGRWNDTPDDTSDDWRGWKKGKYDNRYRRYSGKKPFSTDRSITYYRSGNRKSKIALAIIVPFLLGMFLLFFVNPLDFKMISEQQHNGTPSIEEPSEVKMISQYDITSSDFTAYGCTMTSNGFGDLMLNCSGKNYSCRSNSNSKAEVQPVGITQNVDLSVFGSVCQIDYIDVGGNRVSKSFTFVSDKNAEITSVESPKTDDNKPKPSLEIPKINIQIPTREEIDKKIQETKDALEQTTKSLPTITKPVFDENRIENLIYAYTNEQRVQHGLSKLSQDSKLASIARAHSNDMSERSYFSHDTPEGLDPTDRGLQQGYRCHKSLGGGYYSEGIAENLAQHWLYTSYMVKGITTSYNWHSEESLAKEIVVGWMNSAGHRQNILTSTYDRIGIGIAISDEHAVYATQNFC